MPNWRSIGSYLTLALAPLAITVVVGLTAGAILAQSNPPGPGVSKQDEPIKRTVLFRGDLEGAPGKEIVVFVADLTPEAVGAKHYHPGPEFFYVLEGTLTHELEDGSTHMMKMGAFGSNLVAEKGAEIPARSLSTRSSTLGRTTIGPSAK